MERASLGGAEPAPRSPLPKSGQEGPGLCGLEVELSCAQGPSRTHELPSRSLPAQCSRIWRVEGAQEGTSQS